MKRPLCLVGTTLALAAARDLRRPIAADDDPAIVPVPPVADSSLGQRELHRPHPSYLQPPESTSLRGRRQSHQPQHRRLFHATTGTFRNLVLPLRFSDHAERVLPSQSDISRLYNSEETIGGLTIDGVTIPGIPGSNADDVVPTGSVRQVYHANSRGEFTINTTVVDWITLDHPESYYANGNHGFPMFRLAVIEGLEKLDMDGFDFTEYDLDENGALDGLGVHHSGYAAEFGGDDCHGAKNLERIWSHKGRIRWTSGKSTADDGDNVKVNRYYVSSALRGKCHSNIVRMGVICHELGHYIGLPDLYDNTFAGSGIGSYDFMSHTWGWDGSGSYPPSLSAWSKLMVGWADVELIESDGTYHIEAAAASNKVYKIEAGYPEGEYLLIENRQPIGYDVRMAGDGGLAIYHIDENAKGQRFRGYPEQGGWPENGNHYKVALLAADGSYHLEKGENHGDVGDLWHSGSAIGELMTGQHGFYPNTDSYQDGDVVQTGIRIYGFGDSGHVMTFSVEGLGSVAFGHDFDSGPLDDVEQSGDESTESIFALMDEPDPPTSSPTPLLKRKRQHDSTTQ